MKKTICVILLGFFLSGCSNNSLKVTGDPKKTITLEAAFRSVGKSLRALNEEKGDKMYGLMAKDIKVTFDINNDATDDNSITLDASKGITIAASDTNPKGITNNNSTKMESKSHLSGKRANNIVVTFTNIIPLVKDIDLDKLLLLRDLGYLGVPQGNATGNNFNFSTDNDNNTVRVHSATQTPTAETLKLFRELSPEQLQVLFHNGYFRKTQGSTGINNNPTQPSSGETDSNPNVPSAPPQYEDNNNITPVK